MTTTTKTMTDVEIMKKINALETKYLLDSPNPKALTQLAKLYRKVKNPDTLLEIDTGIGEPFGSEWQTTKYTLLHMAVVSGHPQSLVPLVMQKKPNPTIKDQWGDDAVRAAARVAESGFITKGTINLVYEYAVQWERGRGEIDPTFIKHCKKHYKMSVNYLREEDARINS